MADTLFIVPFQIWVYGMLRNTAVRVWLADRAFLLAGLMIQAVNDWMVDELFGPAISDFVLISRGLLPTFFTLAVFALAFGYLAAPFFRVRVVSLGKATGWLLFALLFYQAGPGLYVEGEGLRRGLSAEFYEQVLAQANAAPTTSGPISVLNAIADGPDDAMGALDNQFGAFIPSDHYVDGLDLAMAYLLGTGDDVVYALGDLPGDFEDEYFDAATGPLFFLSMDAQARTDSINQALSGISRLALASLIIVFGLFEQAIYLCLSIAAGILFVSMSVAILFAFFERTELIARTLIDMWLELFILSAIISVMQAFVVGLVTVGARTLNPTLTLGASIIGAIVMAVLLFKAIGAIWDALNRMFGAMSQSVGGGLSSPAEAGRAVAGALAGTALTVATAGAGAAIAAGAGASLSQVAGSALSGMDTLYNAAAMGSFLLPDQSSLKGTAQGFYEGALSSRLLGPAGGLLLRGGPSQAASPVTNVGAAGAAGGGSSGGPGAGPTPPPGETNIRLDAADLAGLRDAVSTAMNQALARAPLGGYASQAAALGAVQEALRAVPLEGAPTGYAAGDPRMDAYLERRAPQVARHVMLASREQAGGTRRLPPAVHYPTAGLPAPDSSPGSPLDEERDDV